MASDRQTLLIALVALAFLAAPAWAGRSDETTLINGGAYAVEFGGEAMMEAKYLERRATWEAQR